MASAEYRMILEDLNRAASSTEICMPLPYEKHLRVDEKLDQAFKALLRAKRVKDRSLCLLNAYYIGELLEKEAETPAKREVYAQQLSQYYRITTVRLYYLYEFLGPQHLMRSKSFTLTTLRKLDIDEYKNLLAEALTMSLN